MPTDTSTYTRHSTGIIHCDKNGIWEEPQTITFPRLSNARWNQIYRWMADNALVESFLNLSYWDEPALEVNELHTKDKV